MKISQRCGVKLIIASFILLALTLFAFVATLCIHIIIRPMIERAVVFDVVRCSPNVAYEIQQHGRYWVLKNYAVAEKKGICGFDLTMTLQGSYKDIYKLDDLYFFAKLINVLDLPTSFAVYIPDVQHFNRTLTAIAYVRNCHFAPISDGKRRFYIREYVTFHLYFRFELLEELSGYYTIGNKQWLDNYSVCNTTDDVVVDGGVGTSSSKSLESTASIQNAVVVGRNIAQLAAQTKLVLGLDAKTYPSIMMFTTLIAENIFIEDFDNFDRTVLRLPLILVHHLQRGETMPRMTKSSLENLLKMQSHKYLLLQDDPFGTGDWVHVTSDGCLEHVKHTFAEYQQQLFAHKSYFLGRKEMPLLGEHEDLSLMENENLRIYAMLLLQYNFKIPLSVYVLHNISTYNERYRYRFQSLRVDVLKQYEIVYGPEVEDNDSTAY